MHKYFNINDNIQKQPLALAGRAFGALPTLVNYSPSKEGKYSRAALVKK